MTRDEFAEDATPPTESTASESAATDSPTPPDSVPLSGSESPVSFAAVSTHDELLTRSETHCARAVEAYDFDVDLSLVDWSVSTRAKRRAAAVKRPRLPDVDVGRAVDWERIRDRHTGPGGADPRRCTLSLTWAAFEAFDREEWTATLRHELVHVEQFQAFGTTDHGRRFRRRAAAVDAPVKCRRFASPKYVLRCVDCDGVVARRYRDCKLVGQRDRYQSRCCGADLRLHRPDD